MMVARSADHGRPPFCGDMTAFGSSTGRTPVLRIGFRVIVLVAALYTAVGLVL